MPLSNQYKPQVSDAEIEEIESRYDDLCHTKALLAEYRKTVDDDDDEFEKQMKKLSNDITKALRTFHSAISTLDEEKVEKCLEVYEKALDGNDDEEKFARHWKKMLKKKVGNKV